MDIYTKQILVLIINDLREKNYALDTDSNRAPPASQRDCAYMAHALSIQPRGTRLRSESRAQLTLS